MTYLAEQIALGTGQTVASGFIRKVRRTKPMKECHTVSGEDR
jgi:hypothetical protein